MRFAKLFVLYAGLVLGANTVAAETGALVALAEGDLAKIRFHSTAKPVTSAPFVDANGGATSLEAWHGRHVLLNFWALWCAPCREEMPGLNRLEAQLGGAGFAVLTVATGRNARPAVDAYFTEAGLSRLPKLFDPKMTMAQDLGVRGLPVSILIGPDGTEIGRVTGAVEWDSPAAIRLIQAWMAAG